MLDSQTTLAVKASDMAAIVEYFHGVRDGLASQYLVGAYGSYLVLNTLKNSAYPPDKFWQTYAWSGGSVYPGNVYQYQNSVMIGGIPADRDHIYTSPGAWPEIGGEDVKLNNLVLYYGDADLQIAANMALKFQCPIVQATNATCYTCYLL